MCGMIALHVEIMCKFDIKMHQLMEEIKFIFIQILSITTLIYALFNEITSVKYKKSFLPSVSYL